MVWKPQNVDYSENEMKVINIRNESKLKIKDRGINNRQ